MAAKRRAAAASKSSTGTSVRRSGQKFSEGFLDTCQEAEVNSGRPGLMVSSYADRIAIGLPFHSFSQQWFYHNTGYVLGRVALYVGESGSCKSAVTFDQMRLHLESDPEAMAKYIFTESRDTPTLRKSIVTPEYQDRVVGPVICKSIQEWQTASTDILRWLNNSYDLTKTDGPDACSILCTDSLVGVTAQSTVDNIWKNGCASPTFAIDANLINQYLKFLPGEVNQWPLSWVATNHVKFSIERTPQGRPYRVMRIPGGDALKFHATFVIEMQNHGPVNWDGCNGGHRITMKSLKNSLGERHKELEVEMLWWYHPTGRKDSDGQDIKEQVTAWDWHGASVKLLAGHLQDKKTSEVGDIVGDIIHSPANRSAKAPKFGFKAYASAAEIGKVIAEDAATMKALQSFYGIHPVTPFRSGVPWKIQLADAVALGQLRNVAEGASDDDDDNGDE